MRRYLMVILNIVIVAGIIAFVFNYTRNDQKLSIQTQTQRFEDTAEAMEQVMANYLGGEQRICDVWAHYIESSGMSMEEAIDFVKVSHVHKDTSAHIIYLDDPSFSGLSTRESITEPGNFNVSYYKMDIISQDLDYGTIGSGVNITRAFINPLNGLQSIAFCNNIHLNDGGTTRRALLMRVVPISAMQDKWAFVNEDFRSSEMAIIDIHNNYVLKGNSYKNANFIEFFKSYNSSDPVAVEALEKKLHENAGTFRMTNAIGTVSLVAHAPVKSSEGWVLLNMIDSSQIKGESIDWVLIGIVTACLLVILVIDITYMFYYSRRYKQAAAEADSANRAKTDFLSTMSHDIRTPMNAIIGLTSIAERNVEDKVAVSDNLHKISLASNHLLTLINDILDISKVESGKLNLSPVTFSLAETAQNLVNMSLPLVKEKNIDFSFRVSRMETEYLYADQLRLNQVFINILSNAVKYTGEGGRVAVDMQELTSPKEGCVRLVYKVSDTGIGMTEDFMKRMYDPFSRQTDSRVNKVQGTGLGLAITKQMVDLMEGSIDCQSKVGEGTTFTVTLDIPKAEKQIENLDLGPVKVLIVDDDEVLLETASDALISLGAKASTASSGLEALELTEKQHSLGDDFDIIIIDWRMPEMDGVELARRIRAQAGEDIPILLISAYDWSDIEDVAREAGANGFISKPLFRSGLYEKINELLGVKSSAAEPEEDNSDIAGMNILVAEDNDINYEIVSTLLSMYGISTERAENGRIAVEKMAAAKKGSYDLIFMDIQMPEMNGLRATEAIRALDDPWANSIPIIAMTADAFSENVAECMSVGMNGHIAKPIDIKIVIKEIKRIKDAQKQ